MGDQAICPDKIEVKEECSGLDIDPNEVANNTRSANKENSTHSSKSNVSEENLVHSSGVEEKSNHSLYTVNEPNIITETESSSPVYRKVTPCEQLTNIDSYLNSVDNERKENDTSESVQNDVTVFKINPGKQPDNSEAFNNDTPTLLGAEATQTSPSGSSHMDDAHLTYVDQDDGLLKFLGKACGVNKKKLLDEDFEPYSNNESVGARLALSGGRPESPPIQDTNYTRYSRTGPQGNDSASGFGESDETRQRRNRMFYKKTDPRTGVSPVRQSGGSNQANTNVSELEDTDRVSSRAHEPCDNDECYDFSHPRRGYMVLVVNDRFRLQTPRDGAAWDLIKMKEIRRKFGFSSLRRDIRENNLNKPELLQVLSEAQKKDHSDCDCFLLMISSHGLEQPNARAGGKLDHALVCSDEQLIFTSTIIEMFNDTNCPSLRGKPKILLIQACRGEDLDHGHNMYVAHPKGEDKTCSAINPGNPRHMRESFDSPDTHGQEDTWQKTRYSQPTESTSYRHSHPQFCVPNVSRTNTNQEFINTHSSRPLQMTSSRNIQKIYAPTPYAIVETPSLKCDTDMLVLYAIPPGMFAWRNSQDGSWMIDYLHRVLMEYDFNRPKNFLLLLTRVNAMMSRRSTYTPSKPETHQKTAVSVIEHKLDKDIIFQQKAQLSNWIR